MRGASVFSFLLFCLISNVYSAQPAPPPLFPQLKFTHPRNEENKPLKFATLEAHNQYQTHLTDMRHVIKNPDKPGHRALIIEGFGKEADTNKIEKHIDGMIAHPINIKSLHMGDGPQGQSITHDSHGLVIHGPFLHKSANGGAMEMLRSVSQQRGTKDTFVLDKGKMTAVSGSMSDHPPGTAFDGNSHIDLIREYRSHVMHQNTAAYPRFAAIVENYNKPPQGRTNTLAHDPHNAHNAHNAQQPPPPYSRF